MITSTAKAEHATIIIKITENIVLSEEAQNTISEYVYEQIKKYSKPNTVKSLEIFHKILSPLNMTQLTFNLEMHKIPDDNTIDRYRLMIKNAVEAKYNELKNPFDEWSVKA